MNLQEFVAQTLKEIIAGVKDAQVTAKSTGATINPLMATLSSKDMVLGQALNGVFVHLVDFDVAVTVSEGEEAKGGIGIVTGFLGLGAQSKSESFNSAISRIKFKVPICFPKE